MFEPGDHVTYHAYNRTEIGIVKSISDESHVFVVYHCDGNWHRYDEYTAARTKISDLTHGWGNEPNFQVDISEVL